MGWQGIAGLIAAIGTPIGVMVTAYLSFRGKRTETKTAEGVGKDNAIAARWDDASELATKMREYVAAEVEKQVAPIRKRLAEVEAESHEMAVAVRSREVQLWMWNIQGRAGRMPELPGSILHRLGIGHLAAEETLETTQGSEQVR